MTSRGRIALTIGFVFVLAAAALLPLVAARKEPTDIVVVTRGMAFYLGQDRTSSNPAIHVAPGESVRITLVNEDAGFDHDFAIGAWRVNTPMIRGAGRTSILFEAPDHPTKAEYVCTLHAQMMKGTIEVGP